MVPNHFQIQRGTFRKQILGHEYNHQPLNQSINWGVQSLNQTINQHLVELWIFNPKIFTSWILQQHTREPISS